MEAHDVMRAMTQRARELGWAVEADYRHNEDGTHAYYLNLWQVSGSKPEPVDPRARVAYLENELDEEKAAAASLRMELEHRIDQLGGVVEALTQTLALRDGELASANAQRDHARANALMDVGEAMSPTGEWPPEAIGEVIPAVRAMAHRERDRGDDTKASDLGVEK